MAGWTEVYSFSNTEFRVDKDQFSDLEIRDAQNDSGFHYFFNTRTHSLVTDFVLEDRPQVATLCSVALFKKPEGYSPRLRFWKKDKTKKATQEFNIKNTPVTRIVKASVDTRECYESFWKVIDFLQSFAGISLPENVFRVVSGDSAQLAKILGDSNKEIVLSAVKESIGESLTESDISLLLNRRKQLDLFHALLRTPDAMEAYRSEIKREGVKRPGVENAWQHFFEVNPWIFGYGLSLVSCEGIDNGKLERITTGASLFTGAGKRSDAVMRTKGMISTLVFCEIKTHETKLLESRAYREPDVFQPSLFLTGAVSQVHKTAEKAIQSMSGQIQKLYQDDGTPTDIQVSSVRPRRIVIIGTLDQLMVGDSPNIEKMSAFELYRNGLSEVEVITFDELYERARFIVTDN